MYANAKMIDVETVQEYQGTEKEVEGVHSSMRYLIYFKYLCKCYNVPTPHTKKIVWPLKTGDDSLVSVLNLLLAKQREKMLCFSC
jgi:hypothetical protein